MATLRGVLGDVSSTYPFSQKKKKKKSFIFVGFFFPLIILLKICKEILINIFKDIFKHDF